MLLCQKAPGLQAGVMHAGALDDGIGAGKINVLKHAHRVRRGAAVGADGAQAGVVCHHDLAGQYIAHKVGTYGVQRAGFRSKSPAGAIRQLANAERAEAIRIARGDQFGVGHNDQAVSTHDLLHRAADSCFNIRADQAVLGQQIADDLGVRSAVEDRTVHFQLVAQLGGIGQVAVVADGHSALAVVQNHGLGVGAGALAAGGIAHMAGGHLGILRQVSQHARGKYLADQAKIAVAGQHTVHVQGNAAAFLAAVLQGIQRAVHGADHVGFAGGIIDTEHAAFFMQCFGGTKLLHSVLRFLFQTMAGCTGRANGGSSTP